MGEIEHTAICIRQHAKTFFGQFFKDFLRATQQKLSSAAMSARRSLTALPAQTSLLILMLRCTSVNIGAGTAASMPAFSSEVAASSVGMRQCLLACDVSYDGSCETGNLTADAWEVMSLRLYGKLWTAYNMCIWCDLCAFRWLIGSIFARDFVHSIHAGVVFLGDHIRR